MKAKPFGPLSIDGVALGLTRAEVDGVLGRATTNANPAWARYYPPASEWRVGKPALLPVLVSFRPAWPQHEAHVWRVQSLCGSVLRQGDAVLAEIGDTCADVRGRLGIPEEVFGCEPGFSCLVYDGCLITYDDHSESVVEISLRFPCKLALLNHHPPAATLLDGALAC